MNAHGEVDGAAGEAGIALIIMTHEGHGGMVLKH
jgi:hypothetical protein